VSLIIILIVR